jgi:transcriptional/translational regulatory protein YebC/TACO1
VGVVTVTGDGGDILLEAALDAGADDVAAAPEDNAWEVSACCDDSQAEPTAFDHMPAGYV